MKLFKVGIVFLLILSLNDIAVAESNNSENVDKPRSDYIIQNVPVNSIKIKFCAMSANEEAIFIVRLLENYEWYKTNGYSISLPNHPLVEKVKSGGSLQFDEIKQFKKDFINNIYIPSSYQAGLKKLEESQVRIQSCFPTFIDYQKKWKTNKWDFKVFPEYTVKLTLYGPGGSYNPLNGTIIMLTTTTGIFKGYSEPGQTIVHEMIHMAVEEFVIKYNIPHWVKEHIVDRFANGHFSTVFPDYKMQSNGDKTIDTYLDQLDSWEKLPYYISRFANGKPPK